jgi:hypothetical protein
LNPEETGGSAGLLRLVLALVVDRGGVAMATTAGQVLAMCAEVFPDEPVPERARLILEDVFEAPAPGQSIDG